MAILTPAEIADLFADSPAAGVSVEAHDVLLRLRNIPIRDAFGRPKIHKVALPS